MKRRKNSGGFNFGDDDMPLATGFGHEARGGSVEVTRSDLSRRGGVRKAFQRWRR
jgi:hypothetical protein